METKQPELYQIKRSLLNKKDRSLFPFSWNIKRPLSWWLEDGIATKEQLEKINF